MRILVGTFASGDFMDSKPKTLCSFIRMMWPVSILLVVVACSGEQNSAPSQNASSASTDRPTTPGNSREVQSTELERKVFTSTELHEVGLGPDGLAMGTWRLSFREQGVTWDYSDVREKGNYRLASDGTVTSSLPKMKGDDNSDGFYDVNSERVYWRGKWYRLERH